MKTILENINDIEKKLKVTFEWDEVKDDFEKLVKKLRKDLKLDGFRPGKVPMSLAKRHLGPRIQYDFINTMIEKTFDAAAKDAGLNDYIGSSLEDVKFEENEPFVYDIKIEVDPELTLPPYKDGFTVKRKEYLVEDDDIASYLESVKKERAEVEKIDGEIETGFFVTVDLVKEDKTKQEDVQWEVGQAPIDGDVEKEFIGKKAGDEFSVELTIENNTSKNTITIKSVQKHTYPEINDEWVKENMKTVESLDAWKQQIKESMAKELNDRAKFEYEQNIKNWFKENMEVALPQTRVENYLEGMVKQFSHQQGENSNVNPEEIKKFFKPQAEESVLWFLIEEKIKEEEGLDVTSEDFDKKVDEMIAQYPEEQRESFRNIYKQDNYKNQLELQILSEKIFAHIKEFVTDDIEEIRVSELSDNQ